MRSHEETIFRLDFDQLIKSNCGAEVLVRTLRNLYLGYKNSAKNYFDDHVSGGYDFQFFSNRANNYLKEVDLFHHDQEFSLGSEMMLWRRFLEEIDKIRESRSELVYTVDQLVAVLSLPCINELWHPAARMNGMLRDLFFIFPDYIKQFNYSFVLKIYPELKKESEQEIVSEAKSKIVPEQKPKELTQFKSPEFKEVQYEKLFEELDFFYASSDDEEDKSQHGLTKLTDFYRQASSNTRLQIINKLVVLFESTLATVPGKGCSKSDEESVNSDSEAKTVPAKLFDTAYRMSNIIYFFNRLIKADIFQSPVLVVLFEFSWRNIQFVRTDTPSELIPVANDRNAFEGLCIMFRNILARHTVNHPGMILTTLLNNILFMIQNKDQHYIVYCREFLLIIEQLCEKLNAEELGILISNVINIYLKRENYISHAMNLLVKIMVHPQLQSTNYSREKIFNLICQHFYKLFSNDDEEDSDEDVLYVVETVSQNSNAERIIENLLKHLTETELTEIASVIRDFCRVHQTQRPIFLMDGLTKAALYQCRMNMIRSGISILNGVIPSGVQSVIFSYAI